MDKSAYLKLNEVLEILVTRPRMILIDPDFHSLKYFLYGYLSGLHDNGQKDINLEITEWLWRKTRRKSSLFWFDHIYHIIAKKDENFAYCFILAVLGDFLDEKLKVDARHETRQF